MNYKKIIVIGASILVVMALAVLTVSMQRNKQQSAVTEQTATTTVNSLPQKTDFGTSMPTDFPADIPVEKGIKFEQSYSLNYVGQKQLTIVFLSTKTVKENYSLYADFLKKQNWIISNKYESTKLSSLYGTKGNNDINVTISENTSIVFVKSKVSISVLKK